MTAATPKDDASRTGRYLWVVLSLIFGSVVAQALTAQGISVLYPFIQQEFNLSHAQVGLITSSQAIALAVTVGIAGWFTDAMGVKRMIVLALFSMTAFTLAFPLAFGYPLVLALVALLGVAASPMYPATTLAIMDWFPGRIRAVAMSVKQSGFPVGGALTAALLPAVAIAAGWRLAAAGMGLFILAVSAIFAWRYREAPRSGGAAHRFGLADLRAILGNRGRATTIVWGAAFVGFQYVVLTYFMLFLMEEVKLSAVAAGGMLAIAQTISSFSRILWGAISDFVFHGRRVAALAIAGFLTAGWMLIISFISEGVSVAVIFLIAVLIGISTISFHGVFTTLLGELAEPGQVGVTVGLASTLMHSSQAIVPPVFGFVVDLSLSYSLGWQAAAALALALTLALLAFGREPPRR